MCEVEKKFGDYFAFEEIFGHFGGSSSDENNQNCYFFGS